MRSNILILIVISSIFACHRTNAQWQHAGLESDTILTLYNYKQMIYAGCSNGLFKSTDRGGLWARKESGLSGVYVFGQSLSGNAEYLFIVQENSYTTNKQPFSVYRSSNGGDNWTGILSNTEDNPVDIVSNDSNVYVAGSYKNVYISTDNGATWRKENINWSYNQGVDKIALVDSVIFAAMLLNSQGRGTLFRSFNSGYSWNQMSAFSSYASTWMDQVKAYGHDLYIGCHKSNWYGERGGGVVYSSDYGDNWKLLTTSFGYDISVDALHKSGNYLFASIFPRGIYYTSDNGSNWFNISHGSNFADSMYINSIETDDRYVYIGTNGAGVWRYSLSEVLGVDDHLSATPASLLLAQNAPNPFSAITTIRYAIPSQGNVSINVHDMLGRLVKTLVSGIKPPGQYEANFSAEGLPNGMYLYTLEAGGVRLVRKMVLFR